MFEAGALAAEFELLSAGFVFEAAVFEVLPVFEVFEATVAAGDGDAAVLVLTLLVALLAGAASPQAIPRAPNAKTDESAITFFITNSSLLSSSKSMFTYFY